MKERHLLRSEKQNTKMLISLTAVSLCLLVFFNGTCAADIEANLTKNGVLEGDLVMQFRAEEIFDENVVKFLTRGFTVQIEYVIELWRSRRWWFDHLDTQYNIKYQIEFDPLEKRYLCLVSRQEKPVKSRVADEMGSVIQWVTSPEFPIIIIPVVNLDPKASYYYNVIISVATLTAEDLNDLRRWIEYGEKEKERSTLTKTSFKLAKDVIFARHRKRVSTRSEKFIIRDIHRFESPEDG